MEDNNTDITDYLSEDERKSLIASRKRMERARDERDAKRDEFDGMGYLDAYDRDTKSALAYIAPAQNEGEDAVSTGTTRQALISLISRALSYESTTEFRPFDGDDNLLRDLGHALEISVDHSNYLDNEVDQSKTRINELYSHGDVICYEDFVTRHGTKKSIPEFNGEISGTAWTEEQEVIFSGCERRTVQGRRFYFGDIFQDSIDKMPFCFEVNHSTRAEVDSKYHGWERLKYVTTRKEQMDNPSAYAEDWRLEDSSDETDDTVEEIIYVDLPGNEMQLFLNGVPMLPDGFPSKWEHGKYPWAHEGGEPIRTGFIYHRSFVRTLLNMQDIENDMWRVIIMLAWKAAMPPMANATGQVITRKQLMASSIVDGIEADMLKPIMDGSLSNTNFIQNVAGMVRDNMVGRSVPEIKQGISPSASATATSVMQTQKEAEIAISLNLTSAMRIKTKLDWLRGGNILQYMFDSGYTSSFERPGDGGIVRHVAKVVDKLDSSEAIRNEEDAMEKREGQTVRIVQVHRDAKKLIRRLEAVSVTKPRPNSNLDKIELNQMMQAAQAIFGDRLDPTIFDEMFRAAYRIPQNKPLTHDVSDMPAPQSPKAKIPQQSVPELTNNTPA